MQAVLAFFQANQEITGTALLQWPFCLDPNSLFAIPYLPIDVISTHVWHIAEKAMLNNPMIDTQGSDRR